MLRKQTILRPRARYGRNDCARACRFGDNRFFAPKDSCRQLRLTRLDWAWHGLVAEQVLKLSANEEIRSRSYLLARHPLRVHCGRQALFAGVSLVVLVIAPTALRIPAIAVLFLMSRSAGRDWRVSGRRCARPSRMNTIGGALMMTVTAAIGRIPGVSVG